MRSLHFCRQLVIFKPESVFTYSVLIFYIALWFLLSIYILLFKKFVVLRRRNGYLLHKLQMLCAATSIDFKQVLLHSVNGIFNGPYVLEFSLSHRQPASLQTFMCHHVTFLRSHTEKPQCSTAKYPYCLLTILLCNNELL